MGLPIHGTCGSQMTVRGIGAWPWDCDNARDHPDATVYECEPCRVWDTDRSWERCRICDKPIGSAPHLAHAGSVHYECALAADGDWYYRHWARRREILSIV